MEFSNNLKEQNKIIHKSGTIPGDVGFLEVTFPTIFLKSMHLNFINTGALKFNDWEEIIFYVDALVKKHILVAVTGVNPNNNLITVFNGTSPPDFNLMMKVHNYHYCNKMRIVSDAVNLFKAGTTYEINFIY